MRIAIAWLNRRDARLDAAQNEAAARLIGMGHKLVIFDDRRRPIFGELLQRARDLAGTDSHFGFINSDCVPMQEFLGAEAAAGFGVVGIKRVESIGWAVCGGVDGYVFNSKCWDEYYCGDIPQMFVGASHVDWWISRLAQKHGFYKEFIGLRHLSHPRTESSLGRDEIGEHNIREFEAWADRHGISKR